VNGAPFSSGYLRAGANANPHWAGDKWYKEPKLEVLPTPKPDPLITMLNSEISRTHAQLQGYTGDQCSNCNSMRMKVSGHCMVCEDCGTTTGCS